jgi:hypothetical protein
MRIELLGAFFAGAKNRAIRGSASLRPRLRRGCSAPLLSLARANIRVPADVRLAEFLRGKNSRHGNSRPPAGLKQRPPCRLPSRSPLHRPSQGSARTAPYRIAANQPALWTQTRSGAQPFIAPAAMLSIKAVRKLQFPHNNRLKTQASFAAFARCAPPSPSDGCQNKPNPMGPFRDPFNPPRPCIKSPVSVEIVIPGRRAGPLPGFLVPPMKRIYTVTAPTTSVRGGSPRSSGISNAARRTPRRRFPLGAMASRYRSAASGRFAGSTRWISS